MRANKKLCDRINYKYAIKNVTGLNILPFVRFDDPFDIIAHLMVGSEGTLAFLSGVSMNTEYDYPFKASAMLYFKDIREACKAVVAMKKLVDDKGQWIVKSAELLDKKSLASVNDTTGEGLTAILTETKASTAEELRANISKIEECLKAFTTYVPVRFTDKPEEYSKFWAMRSGVFPAVGGTRKLGTRRHRRPARADSAPRLRRRLHLRTHAGGQLPLHHQPVVRLRRRGAPLREPDERREDLGGGQIRRLAEGRARHGT